MYFSIFFIDIYFLDYRARFHYIFVVTTGIIFFFSLLYVLTYYLLFFLLIGIPYHDFHQKRSTCASGNGYVPSCSIGFWVANTRKRIIEFKRHLPYCNLALLHSFEQRTFAPLPGSVYFICQYKISKDRSLLYFKFFLLDAIHHRTYNIGRQQVRCELNSAIY